MVPCGVTFAGRPWPPLPPRLSTVFRKSSSCVFTFSGTTLIDGSL